MKEVIDGWTVVIKRAPSIGGEFIAVGNVPDQPNLRGRFFANTRREARVWLRGLNSGAGKHKFDARVVRARVTVQTFEDR